VKDYSLRHQRYPLLVLQLLNCTPRLLISPGSRFCSFLDKQAISSFPRVWYGDGLEVEFSLTDPGWASLPPDPGTQEVVSDGAQILFDREGTLAMLLASITPNTGWLPSRRDDANLAQQLQCWEARQE
jgi:hypothetical protein